MHTKETAGIKKDREHPKRQEAWETEPESPCLTPSNLSAKGEMVKELKAMGLSESAIGRILHLSKELVALHINPSKRLTEDI